MCTIDGDIQSGHPNMQWRAGLLQNQSRPPWYWPADSRHSHSSLDVDMKAAEFLTHSWHIASCACVAGFADCLLHIHLTIVLCPAYMVTRQLAHVAPASAQKPCISSAIEAIWLSMESFSSACKLQAVSYTCISHTCYHLYSIPLGWEITVCICRSTWFSGIQPKQPYLVE